MTIGAISQSLANGETDMENSFSTGPLPAFAVVGSLCDPTSQCWLSGPRSRTAPARQACGTRPYMIKAPLKV
jgi:hypothetical protein